VKILLEMRPALDGHSGIPQETRLLFRGLCSLPAVQVEGLLQSGNLVLEPGVRRRPPVPGEGDLEPHSKVVVSLQQGAASHRLEHLRRQMLKVLGPAGAGLGALLGRQVRLGYFDPTHFRDYVWRALFAKTLPVSDIEAVVTRPHRVMRWPWSLMNAMGVLTGMMGRPLYVRLDTSDADLAIVETPYPGRFSRRTKLVVRYHDAFPVLMPHTVKARGYHRAMHHHALRRNAADGAWFACVSDATRKDLLAVFPEVAERAVTIPNMVSHHYHEEDRPARLVPEIVGMRRSRLGNPDVRRHWADDGVDRPYLLMVSTLEPRKNHLGLLAAWEQLRIELQADLQLVLVGELGWEHEPILGRLRPWIERGCLHLLEDVPAAELRLLYRHAVATVCPSFGEGFDFSGVEAMRCGGVVAASAIAAHRDTYEDACEYFSPYASGQMVAALKGLIDPRSQERRQALQRRGAEVSARYLPERILPAWQDFLHRIRPA
jgi:glycosyltransferase involved in cell wall biosynthesis